jgi:hypothetical protein
MSMTGKLSPLGVNVLCALHTSQGISVNKKFTTLSGASTSGDTYSSSTLTTDTILSILLGHDASSMTKGVYRTAYEAYTAGNLSESAYRNLLTIGNTSIPALGAITSSASADSSTGWAKSWSYGFYRKISEQAYKELRIVNGTYSDFFNAFSIMHSYMKQKNKVISTMVNAKTHMDGAFSNMNDLITSDIAGVSLSTMYFGKDLITLGRAVSLRNIDTFGLPSNLLMCIKENNAMTQALTMTLIYAGIETTDVTAITDKSMKATDDHERRMYTAFSLLQGTDLDDILVPLNCQTKGLTTLADLLDPKKLFPNSYTTLTMPKFNPVSLPTNSKTYFLIYKGAQTNPGVNTELESYGEDLAGIIPSDQAIACGALRTSLMQIKNIKGMTMEKFANVVANLETTQGMGLVNSSTAANHDLINQALPQFATGTGANGTITMKDFLGAISGTAYDYTTLIQLIKDCTTPTLTTHYNTLLTTLRNPTTTPADPMDPLSVSTITYNEALLSTTVASIQSTLSAILASNPSATKLNTLYQQFQTNLNSEINNRAKALAAIYPQYQYAFTGEADIQSFVDSLSDYATETEEHLGLTAVVIEGFANTDTVSGQSIIAFMREKRNANRLGITGGVLDSDVPDSIPTPPTNRLDTPKVTGAASTPGSLAGSQYQDIIPSNLDIFNITGPIMSSILTPSEAVEAVTTCNCDCWDLLK